MGSFGGFYKGDKKKTSKEDLERRAKRLQGENPSAFKLPELIKKKKDNF